MINVSNEFLEKMEERTDFCENAEITFSDGTVLELGKQDFTIHNNYIVDGAGENSFPLGTAVERSVQIELMNDDEHLSVYDFLGAKIRLYLIFELSETEEKIEMGTFTVLTPETYGDTVIVTAVDDMYKADTEYSSSLLYPATLGSIIRDSCDTAGILLFTADFTNSDFIVQEKPEGITHRQLYGYAAMIAGGNARINRNGYLEILSYSFLDEPMIIDGGSFTAYDQENVYDGGGFHSYDADSVLEGGSFSELEKKHVLYKWKNLKVDTDNIVITGIQTAYKDGEEDAELLEGLEGYVLKIDNPLITGQEKAALKLIGNKLIGTVFRKFEGDHVAYPLVEFMDPIIVTDRKGNVYESVVTDVTFNFFGYTTIKNGAESAIRNSSRFYSAATEAYRKTRKLVEVEKTAREQAVEALNKILEESSGLYQTEVEQEDGSVIYYLHDKPTLGESQNIIKLTAEAIGFSNDGGETYPYGFTLTGEMITKILQTEGVNADWINAGAFTVKGQDGNIIFSADMATRKVTFVDGYFDSEGAHFTNGSFSGTMTASEVTGSRIEGTDIFAGSFSTTYQDAEDYNGSIRIEKASVVFGNQQKMTANNMNFYASELDEGLILWNTPENVDLQLTECASVTMDGATWAIITNDSENYNVQSMYTSTGEAIFNGFNFYKDLVAKNLYSRGTKSRVVDTEHFGLRALYCYEMPLPVFGDMGTAAVNEDGFCSISVDDIFSEAVNCNVEYSVFLQKEGEGDLWVDSKEFTHFLVRGTPGLRFSWELKAVQRGYETVRMSDMALRENEMDFEQELLKIAAEELELYDSELEGLQ